MKISDLFGRVGSYKGSKVNSDYQADGSTSDVNANVDGSGSSDRTTISDKARILSQVAEIKREDDEARNDRIARLKEEVNAGTYLSRVDSRKTAEAIDGFIFNKA